MKLLIVHLSDLHFETSNDSHNIKLDKVCSAINSVEKADKCVVIISGDLAKKGLKNDYKYVKGFLFAVKKYIHRLNYAWDDIYFFMTPGNHDINFSSEFFDYSLIKDAYDEDRIDGLILKYLDSMEDFFAMANEYGCFIDDKYVSQNSVKINGKTIGFVMVNTAPLSLLGGDSQDMGAHYLPEGSFELIEKYAENDINILVMHHSLEWLNSDCKERLRKIISNKYSIVLSGHEHSPVGLKNRINNIGEVQFIQGNALSGYANEGNGFCTLSIDIDTMEARGYSYLWKGDVYVPKQIINSAIRYNLFGEVLLNEEYISLVSYDSYNRKINDYYVFPGVTYDYVDTKKNIKHNCADNENDFFELIKDMKRVFIMGGHKSGKSILAKRIFFYLYSNGKKPVLLDACDINNKRIERTIEYAFQEEYIDNDYSLEKFKQLDIAKKVAIIDNANLIKPEKLEALVDYLAQNMGQIIIFSEDNIDLNLRKQVVDVLANDDKITFKIKPFLYDKRKELIENILKQSDDSCNIRTAFL